MVFTNTALKKQVEKLNVCPFVETFGSYKMEKLKSELRWASTRAAAEAQTRHDGLLTVQVGP